MVCRAGQACDIHFNALTKGTGIDPLPSLTFILHASTCGQDLYDYIERHYVMGTDTFKLYLFSGGKVFDLSLMKDKTMAEVGVDLSFDHDSNGAKHEVHAVHPLESPIEKMMECALRTYNPVPAPQNHPSVWSEDSINFKSFIKSDTNYVGLVNQAMTCYLNSLLQALYMTPEFRNALYNWEYVDGSEKDEANSIPYQLQKLFLNLQTSTKTAVETTALTKSFGWDSTEAWQQHDIQELCRVMFDALEQKFKNTEQADLINRLYEGKMIDYVKCLECGTEKSREDTFLDIPLPVRPFGSNVAYNSVEEAMKAFVQYETLEGLNQYHCEKCNKKCDAHKGLKFTKFPYLLTLHLKRFDFDYKTFHRIKLNDKVTFPDMLNLNEFISFTNQESPGTDEDIGLDVKCDDSSTTDSRTLDDDCPPSENNLSNSNHTTNREQEDDEGIDLSNWPSTSNYTAKNHENEKNRGSSKGPYRYELFSIMIHSGSANGGHYYAYIKDLRTQEWLSFNDQNVTQITHDDIQKTYGGGPTRPYFSAYGSSTNAYMLMYRQIDPARNALPMQAQDFPKHIQELLKKMKESEDNDKKNRETLMSIPRLKIYCHHPIEGKIAIKLYVTPDATWALATEEVYRKFKLEGVVSLNQCRLVRYEPNSDLIECSYEGREQDTVASIWQNQKRFNLMLEIQDKDKKFETYLPGGLVTKVYVIDVPREEVIDGPINVRGLLTQTVREYKQMLGKRINMDPKQMKIVLRKYQGTRVVDNDDSDLQSEEFWNAYKVFVSTMFDTDSNVAFHESTLRDIIESLDNIVSLQVQLPDTSKETLEKLNIPSLEEKCKDKEKPITNGPSKLTVNDSHGHIPVKCNDVPKAGKTSEDTAIRNVSPQLGEGEDWNTPEQSNSEDSSLSDSDKTLVGDDPDDDDFNLEYLRPNASDNRVLDVLCQIGVENWDVDDNWEYNFKATPYTNSNQKLLKVLADKRMRLSTLKKNLEPYVGVPVEYFKVYRNCNNVGEVECNCLTEQLTLYEDGERLTLLLGRALRSGEFKVELYHLLIDSAEPYKFLCEWIISKDMTVGQAKKEILAELERTYDINIPYERCRLRIKYYKTASKVLLDDQNFEKLGIYSYTEMIVQELPDKEPVTNENQTVVFVRRWWPSKMQLGSLQEIVMDEKSFDELCKKTSLISDIPEECIEIARGQGNFPCDISVLQMEDDQQWNDRPVFGCSPNIEDGFVFFYRDSREKPKYLTPEELKEIIIKETSHLAPLSNISSYGPRRERALKIYLDTK